ncbi:hypothetical protein QCM77_41765 [Bradyrhizobium sp. SSUT18]|uniref:hypothetical protein n=1 Tax=Bradyrhizobium sp. SSUT18 TaxID=3040602 RepID=UPI002449CF5F|nr:hypothetical protein [Bradyrhizobium sp. SSUT18]MDH2406356.1 hypothetical protein [Bradyrhizobium sp. SSUT18]
MANEAQSFPAAEMSSAQTREPRKGKSSTFSAVEGMHLVMAFLSFVAALVILWRVIEDVVLGPGSIALSQGIPWDVVVKTGVAAIATASLIWVGLILLKQSRLLALERVVIEAIQQFETSPAAKTELLIGIASRWWGLSGSPSNLAMTDPDSAKAEAAGRWVLDRFREGAVVASIPASLADTDKLRSLAGVSELPIQVLQPGSSEARHD